MPIIEEGIQSDYRVLVSNQNHRPQAELYLFNLRSSLPSFLLPLRSEDVEPILDLQEVLALVYERGGYDYRIDYDLYLPEIAPSLTESEQSWIQEVLSVNSEK